MTVNIIAQQLHSRHRFRYHHRLKSPSSSPKPNPSQTLTLIRSNGYKLHRFRYHHKLKSPSSSPKPNPSQTLTLIRSMNTNKPLERRELGNTGLKVSCVGFGASPLGKVFGPVSEEEAAATVIEAFKRGINFFDTSPYYGGTLSEKVLGKCLKALGVPRDQYIVATKCGRYKEGFDFSAERVTRSINESLERLQLDYVDILQCHDIEFGSLDEIVNETIPALQKIKESGKTKFIGITGLPLDVYTYVLDRVPPGTLDVILSYCHYCLNDSTLEDLLPYLKSKGVGMIYASPLSMGLLTENGPPDWHPASAEIKTACKEAADYCKKNGKNISRLALQYSLSNKDISTILVGMNAVWQVEENVAAAVKVQRWGRDDKTLAQVKDILKPVKDQTWPTGIQRS